MKVDWLFKNVTVIDGSGGPQYRADVAVKGDRIMAIAPALDVAAEQVIDGQGRVLAPGFIDVHTHDDINVIRMPEYLPKLSQGVTTVIVGNCGISAATATMRGGSTGPDESPRRAATLYLSHRGGLCPCGGSGATVAECRHVNRSHRAA